MSRPASRAPLRSPTPAVPRSQRLAAGAGTGASDGAKTVLARLQSKQVSRGGAARSEFPRRLFCQELAVLLDAGIPLFEALTTLREKEESADVARVLSSLTTDLSEGRTLSQAMREQPQAFSALLIASIEASQRTGQTAEALRQHAAYLTWLTGLRDKLVSAAIYPAILIGASLLVISFLTVFVVPRFADIYEGMGGEMPWASAVLLGIGKGVGDHPWLTLGGLVGLGMALPYINSAANLFGQSAQVPNVSQFFTNDLVDEINNFDPEKIRAQARAFKLPYKK